MKKILSAILCFFLSSGLCQAEDTLAAKLWQELEAAKLPKAESEIEVKEELGPSDLAFLEDQLPSPQPSPPQSSPQRERMKNRNEAIASDFGSSANEFDEVSLGQAAPVRRDDRSQTTGGRTIIRKVRRKENETNLFRERSRGKETYTPTEFTPPKLRKRSH